MIWAVDIGNSSTVSGCMKERVVLERDSIPTRQLMSLSGAGKWVKRLQRLARVDDFIVSSVVPTVDGKVRKAIHQATGKAPFRVDARKNAGIPVHYRNRSEVGADRVMNSLAARELYGAPIIVVDYGTATTFDVVDIHGAYCGGVILAGIGLSVKALHEQTAKLPLIDFTPVDRPIGTTTQEGIRSGLYYGTLGATREILLRLRKQLGRVAPAVATGGWCSHFADTHVFHHIEPDLTLIGMSILWRKLHAQH
jgi:type III pantothenate kinase